MCFFGIEEPARQQEVTGLFFANLAQEKGGHDRRHKSDANLGVSEFCVGHCQGEIAQSRETCSSRYGRAVDRCNGWLGEIVDRAEETRHRLRIFAILLGGAAGELTKILEIHAGTECLSRAGDDEDLRGRFIDLCKSAQEIVNQFEADGIALVRPVEGQGGYTGVVMNLDRGIIHLIKVNSSPLLPRKLGCERLGMTKTKTLFGTPKPCPPVTTLKAVRSRSARSKPCPPLSAGRPAKRALPQGHALSPS